AAARSLSVTRIPLGSACSDRYCASIFIARSARSPPPRARDRDDAEERDRDRRAIVVAFAGHGATAAALLDRREVAARRGAGRRGGLRRARARGRARRSTHAA